MTNSTDIRKSTRKRIHKKMHDEKNHYVRQLILKWRKHRMICLMQVLYLWISLYHHFFLSNQANSNLNFHLYHIYLNPTLIQIFPLNEYESLVLPPVISISPPLPRLSSPTWRNIPPPDTSFSSPVLTLNIKWTWVFTLCLVN